MRNNNFFTNFKPKISNSPIPTGYIAYWKLDGNANDETGNYDGNVSGATLTTDRYGDNNKAYLFSSASISTNGNISSVLQDGNFTFVVYLKTSGTSGTDNVYCCGGISAGGKNTALQVTVFGVSAVYRALIDDNSALKIVTSTNPITVNNYSCIIVSRDGGNFNIEVNGVEDTINITGTGSIESTRNFLIGAAQGELSGDKSQYWSGTIDEITVYDRALTIEEKTIFNNRL